MDPVGSKVMNVLYAIQMLINNNANKDNSVGLECSVLIVHVRK